MQEKFKALLVCLVTLALVIVLSYNLGSTITEYRLEKMAQDKGLIFIRNHPYKIIPITYSIMKGE